MSVWMSNLYEEEGISATGTYNDGAVSVSGGKLSLEV